MQNVFRSERLVYRAIETPDDDALFVGMAQDSETTAMLSPLLFKPQSKKDAAEWVKMLVDTCLVVVVICLPNAAPVDGSAPASAVDKKESQANGAEKSASVASTASMTPIGFIALSGLDLRQVQHRRAEIGVGLRAGYRGQGYGSEAIEWVLDWGFSRAGLHRISLGGFGYNVDALRLYRRLGFVEESVKRDFLWFNGSWHNLVELSMLEDEWRARNQKT